MKQLSKHLTFANAISCIALFVALSGAAYAATTTLGKKSVKTQNLANGSVTTLKLKGGSVTNLKLRNGAVTGPKIGPGAVGSGAIAKGAVRSEALGGGVVTSGKLKNGAVNAEKLAGGAVGTNQLATNAVSNGKIQDGAVTSAKLATSLLTPLVRNVITVSKAHVSEIAEAESVAAECPSGKQAIAGGAKIVGGGPNIALTESTPTVLGGKLTGWVASASAVNPPSAWSIEATAICAEF